MPGHQDALMGSEQRLDVSDDREIYNVVKYNFLVITSLPSSDFPAFVICSGDT